MVVRRRRRGIPQRQGRRPQGLACQSPPSRSRSSSHHKPHASYSANAPPSDRLVGRRARNKGGQRARTTDTQLPPARERSPRRREPRNGERGDGSPGGFAGSRATRTLHFDLATHREVPRTRKAASLSAEHLGEAAGTPLRPTRSSTLSPADEVLKTRRAEAMEELVVQRRMLCSQLRAQGESHTFARATARSELQSVELAQQHATTHTRMEMAVSLEAPGQAAHHPRSGRAGGCKPQDFCRTASDPRGRATRGRRVATTPPQWLEKHEGWRLRLKQKPRGSVRPPPHGSVTRRG